eukprot:128226-Prymnesium_polylepis.1
MCLYTITSVPFITFATIAERGTVTHAPRLSYGLDHGLDATPHTARRNRRCCASTGDAWRSSGVASRVSWSRHDQGPNVKPHRYTEEAFAALFPLSRVGCSYFDAVAPPCTTCLELTQVLLYWRASRRTKLGSFRTGCRASTFEFWT